MRLTTTTNKPATSRHGKSHHGTGAIHFTAIDGEGMTFPDGSHRYVMLSVGQDTITNPNGLEFTEICDFIYSHYKPGTAYVGFYLGYDFTQWLKNLPENRARLLLTREGQAIRKPKRMANPAPFPVEYHHWQFDLLNHKRFRLRPKLCHCTNSHCQCDHAPWMYVCDAGGFFQTSFLRAINPTKWPDPVLTAEEYQIIEEGKENRSDAVLGPDMERYNRLENDVLERVMRVFDGGMRQIGVNLPPSKWFGPGQAAQEWLKTCAPKRIDIEQAVPAWFRDTARASYFGGWFEIFAHGIIPGISYEYDINSAYPFIIASLPCLLHGKYTRGHGRPPAQPGTYTLVRATLTGVPGSPIGTMLHRNSKGRICRPMNTEGWFWDHELNSAKRAGLVSSCKYHNWVRYHPCDCPRPIRSIADLYTKRIEIGKNTPIGKACRLVYNSCYGKFAQSIGEPLFANAVYASLITAGCRKQILDAIGNHPGHVSAVLMVATDAVYFTSPHPNLPISNKLGEWDCTEKSRLTLFKPGVYWDDKARQRVLEGKDPEFKSRGVNARDLGQKIDSLDNQFREWNLTHTMPRMTPDGMEDHPLEGWPATSFRPAFSMVSALQALRRGDWALAGAVTTAEESERELAQSSNPWSKRKPGQYDPMAGIYRSLPRDYGDENHTIESEPYDKRFGQEDSDNPFTQESRQAHGITPDGYLIDEIFDAVRAE